MKSTKVMMHRTRDALEFFSPKRVSRFRTKKLILVKP
jgi:hypothetical protein